MTIRIKRVYERPEEEDGCRILVDRLWPRGLAKERARIDLWLRDIAPRDELRRWYSHDPNKWEDFQERYESELRTKRKLVNRIRKLEREKSVVTLLYSTREERYNNAVCLRKIMQKP